MSSTKSRKAKGRKLQDKVRDWVQVFIGFETQEHADEHVRSALMGETGEDVKLSMEARKHFPFQIECKNAEAINVWKAWEQAKSHGEHEPLLVIKKNKQQPLVILDAVFFFNNWVTNDGK